MKFVLICIAAIVICIISLSAPTQAQESGYELSDVCRKFRHATKEGNEHLKTKMNGYTTEVPVTQAIEDFNQMAKCHYLGKGRPPLTKEEFLAAVRYATLVDKKRSWVYKIYQHIGKTEKMPKGTFIDFGLGFDMPGGYSIEKWSIILYVGLNKYTRELKGNPFFKLSIREQYISSEPSKTKPLDPPEKYND